MLGNVSPSRFPVGRNRRCLNMSLAIVILSVINDLGVLVDNRMTFVDHIDSIVSYKTLFVRPGLKYASCLWSPHQEVHSARIERIQQNLIRFALRGLGWTNQPLPPYESKCLLLEDSDDLK
jgi:hypothetical protein